MEKFKIPGNVYVMNCMPRTQVFEYYGRPRNGSQGSYGDERPDWPEEANSEETLQMFINVLL